MLQARGRTPLRNNNQEDPKYQLPSEASALTLLSL
jgi:hypothetical protein